MNSMTERVVRARDGIIRKGPIRKERWGREGEGGRSDLTCPQDPAQGEERGESRGLRAKITFEKYVQQT
eukprot:403861-Hanusia_phi.AAC.2